MNEEIERNNFIKIILVGESTVGKTSIINRFYLNQFKINTITTVSMNFIQKLVDIDGKKISLRIWDTAGQEKFKSCNKLFVKNSNIVIFVYDITSKKSFDNLNYWRSFIINELGDDILFGFVGNKIDLINKEEVSEEMARSKALEWEAYFSLLSAKEDRGEIYNYFIELVKIYLNNLDDEFILIESKTSIKKVSLKNMNKVERNTQDNCCGGKKVKSEGEIKIIFLGPKEVGKTNIIQALRGKEINKKYIPTKKITKYNFNMKNETKIKVNLYDTNGNCEINEELKIVCKKCKIFFFIFDINKRNTFIELKSYINKIKEIIDENNILINILGNKTKIYEEENSPVTQEEGEQLAKMYNGYYETICIEDINFIKNIINKNLEII